MYGEHTIIGGFMQRVYGLFLVLTTAAAFAQPQNLLLERPITPQGKYLLTTATGIPYVGATELSIGVTERITVGILGAYAPPAVAYGARVHAVITSGDDARLFFRMPVIYYPPHRDLFCGKPWILAWPTLHVEWKLDSEVRLSAGAGILGASCIHKLLRHHGGGEEEEGVQMDGIWNTISFGVSVPVSRSVTFNAELSPVLKGIRPAGDDWVAKFPLIVVLGITTSL
jgi:hypothetical protein